MKAKLSLTSLRIKPFFYAIAILCIVPIAANQYINHRSKLVNTDPWIVSEVLSGDRLEKWFDSEGSQG